MGTRGIRHAHLAPVSEGPIARLRLAQRYNLGRFPERIQVDGLYLPECGAPPGLNDLTILDEEGNAISREKLYVEMAASRRIAKR